MKKRYVKGWSGIPPIHRFRCKQFSIVVVRLCPVMIASNGRKLFCLVGSGRLLQAETTWARARSFCRHPSGKMIEVEKKFAITDQVMGNLHALGAVLRKETRFTDVYYDTVDYTLTSENFWLRQRNGIWQLKSTTGDRTAEEALSSSSYRESEREEDIVDLVAPVVCRTTGDAARFLHRPNLADRDDDKARSGLVELLEDFGCKPFCEISTTRRTYALDDFNIDIDATDTGHRVGEIELMAKGEEADVTAMARKIDALAHRLGIPTEMQVSGKVGHYLKAHNPEHYERLFKLKVLV